MYYAHSEASSHVGPEPLREHLQLVADRTSRYATAFGAGLEARICGLLHDLGKYGDLFQRRLQSAERGIDHWSMGAYAAARHYKTATLRAAIAILGHHIGLRSGSAHELKTQLDPGVLAERHPLGLRLSEGRADVLLDRLAADGIALPLAPASSCYDLSGMSDVSAMLDARMLFSALVDADFVETEAFFRADGQGGRN